MATIDKKAMRAETQAHRQSVLSKKIEDARQDKPSILRRSLKPKVKRATTQTAAKAEGKRGTRFRF